MLHEKLLFNGNFTEVSLRLRIEELDFIQYRMEELRVPLCSLLIEEKSVTVVICLLSTVCIWTSCGGVCTC